jgi:hypothetical protein
VRERWEGPGWSNGGASKCRAGIMAREERVVLVSSRQWVPSELTEDLEWSIAPSKRCSAAFTADIRLPQ